MAEETLHLSLERKEIKVFLKGKNGNEKPYTLRELTGKERNSYLNKMKSRVVVEKDGNATVKSFDGMQSDLLEKCLFDETDTVVSEKDIEEFPSSTQLELFKKAQKLSGLDQEVVDDEKNA